MILGSAGSIQALKPLIIRLAIAFPNTFTSEHHQNAGYVRTLSLHLEINKQFSETSVNAFTAKLHFFKFSIDVKGFFFFFCFVTQSCSTILE